MFGVRVSEAFHFIFVHIILFLVGLLSGDLLRPYYVLFVFRLFVILAISRFDLGSDCSNS